MFMMFFCQNSQFSFDDKLRRALLQLSLANFRITKRLDTVIVVRIIVFV